jgi:hypothetical protein
MGRSCVAEKNATITVLMLGAISVKFHNGPVSTVGRLINMSDGLSDFSRLGTSHRHRLAY